jgi:hypothetical protein
MIQDDFVFEPYGGIPGAYRCEIPLKTGNLSIRFGGHGLFTSKDNPYEVWYPGEAEPDGYQTAEEIWRYIRLTSPNGC